MNQARRAADGSTVRRRPRGLVGHAFAWLTCTDAGLRPRRHQSCGFPGTGLAAEAEDLASPRLSVRPHVTSCRAAHPGSPQFKLSAMGGRWTRRHHRPPRSTGRSRRPDTTSTTRRGVFDPRRHSRGEGLHLPASDRAYDERCPALSRGESGNRQRATGNCPLCDPRQAIPTSGAAGVPTGTHTAGRPVRGLSVAARIPPRPRVEASSIRGGTRGRRSRTGHLANQAGREPPADGTVPSLPGETPGFHTTGEDAGPTRSRAGRPGLPAAARGGAKQSAAAMTGGVEPGGGPPAGDRRLDGAGHRLDVRRVDRQRPALAIRRVIHLNLDPGRLRAATTGREHVSLPFAVRACGRWWPCALW